MDLTLTYSECDILLVLNSSNEVRLFFTWRISVRLDPAVSCITVQNIGHGIILIVLCTHQVTRSEQTSVTVSGPGLCSVSAATSCVSLHRSQSHSPVSRFSKLLRNSFSKLKSRTVPKTSLRSKSRSRTTIYRQFLMKTTLNPFKQNKTKCFRLCLSDEIWERELIREHMNRRTTISTSWYFDGAKKIKLCFKVNRCPQGSLQWRGWLLWDGDWCDQWSHKRGDGCAKHQTGSAHHTFPLSQLCHYRQKLWGHKGSYKGKFLQGFTAFSKPVPGLAPLWYSPSRPSWN